MADREILQPPDESHLYVSAEHDGEEQLTALWFQIAPGQNKEHVARILSWTKPAVPYL